MTAESLGTRHIPIMPLPIVQGLTEKLPELCFSTPHSVVIDCTFGGGGHTGLLLDQIAAQGLGQKVLVLALDQDIQAIERGSAQFQKQIGERRLLLAHQTFGMLDQALAQAQEFLGASPQPVALLADLGFSSDQIEDGERGLSFMKDGPLDMRLSQSRGEPLYQRLARVNIKELEEVLRDLGEERHWAKIARAICDARREQRLPKTTRAFADLVSSQIPSGQIHASRIHPATRVFQALRIWVNDELGELDRLLTGPDMIRLFLILPKNHHHMTCS